MFRNHRRFSNAVENPIWNDSALSESRARIGRFYTSKRPFVARQSGLDMNLWFPSPRQQFVESVDGMSIDHAHEYVVQVSVGFDAVEFAGLDQRTDDCPTLSA